MQQHVYSVTYIVECFGEALRVIVPIAERLSVAWREPANYEDWDVAATGLYDGFVLAGVRSSMEWDGFLPLVSYDSRRADYRGDSFVAVDVDGLLFPLVCLETAVHPFDMCLAAKVGDGWGVEGYIKRPIADSRFVLVAREQTGCIKLIETVSYAV